MKYVFFIFRIIKRYFVTLFCMGENNSHIILMTLHYFNHIQLYLLHWGKHDRLQSWNFWSLNNRITQINPVTVMYMNKNFSKVWSKYSVVVSVFKSIFYFFNLLRCYKLGRNIIPQRWSWVYTWILTKIAKNNFYAFNMCYAFNNYVIFFLLCRILDGLNIRRHCKNS